jgi:hypothetical protein
MLILYTKRKEKKRKKIKAKFEAGRQADEFDRTETKDIKIAQGK